MTKELVPFFGLFDSFIDEWEPVIWDAKPLTTYSKSLEDKYIIVAEIPGIPQDKINIEYKENMLNISAEYDEKNELLTRKGKYKTSYRINGIDSEKIEASLTDGILTVSLPKAKSAIPKKIEILKN